MLVAMVLTFVRCVAISSSVMSVAQMRHMEAEAEGDHVMRFPLEEWRAQLVLAGSTKVKCDSKRLVVTRCTRNPLPLVEEASELCE